MAFRINRDLVVSAITHLLCAGAAWDGRRLSQLGLDCLGDSLSAAGLFHHESDSASGRFRLNENLHFDLQQTYRPVQVPLQKWERPGGRGGAGVQGEGSRGSGVSVLSCRHSHIAAGENIQNFSS